MTTNPGILCLKIMTRPQVFKVGIYTFRQVFGLQYSPILEAHS